jgi:hypothetical protein
MFTRSQAKYADAAAGGLAAREGGGGVPQPTPPPSQGGEGPGSRVHSQKYFSPSPVEALDEEDKATHRGGGCQTPARVSPVSQSQSLNQSQSQSRE